MRSNRSLRGTSFSLLFVAACVFWGVAVAGCRQESAEGPDLKKELEEEGAEEKPKEDFEITRLETVPADTSFAFPFVKPGHWLTARHEVTANFYDFQGELWTSTTDITGKLLDVPHTLYQLRSARPAPLPKEQTRSFETLYYVPPSAASLEKGVWLNRELRAARGGRLIKQDPYKVAAMPPYQYYLVVLADEPDQHGYIKHLTSIDAPAPSDSPVDTLTYYRVSYPTLDKVAPLPSHSLTWSSTAYIFWDEVDPEIFTEAQQEALVDWLHWGGQLIVSGPGSLERLQESFLADYLPVEPGPLVEAPQEKWNALSRTWSLIDHWTEKRLTLPVEPDRPLIVMNWHLRPEGTSVPGCGSLVAERRVGRGRIAVTAFRLSDPLIVNWGSFDNFFNAVLLRRPRRVFQGNEFGAETYWKDYEPEMIADARLSTTLRYFARDMGHFRSTPSGLIPATEPDEWTPVDTVGAAGLFSSLRPAVPQERRATNVPDLAGRDPFHFQGYPRLPLGAGAWNDRSGVADAARQAIRDAAGISIPRRRFVLQVLLVYLIVLVPLNWGIFRLLGRVEWAWVAAPVIAIATAVAVIRLAQLDIGFARSRTEISVCEAYGDYSRAHVSRFVGLYTSLATSYDVQFSEEQATALPFSSVIDLVRTPNDPTYVVQLRRDRHLQLTGFVVPSNKTQILRCEQMMDLGGGFTWQKAEGMGYELRNGTTQTLRGAGILARTMDGEMRGAWLGDLASGEIRHVDLMPLADDQAHLPQWDETLTTLSCDAQRRRLLAQYDRDRDGQLEWKEAIGDAALHDAFPAFDGDIDGIWDWNEMGAWCRAQRSGEACLGELLQLSTEALGFAPGEVRLVGWHDQPLPEMEIRPKSSQVIARTLFLVHLQAGVLEPPQSDLNRAADMIEPEKPDDSTEATGDAKMESQDTDAGEADRESREENEQP